MSGRFASRFFAIHLSTFALAAFLSGCAGTSGTGTKAGQGYLVYVGTNVAGDQANTIYLYRLSAATGALTPVSAQRGGSQPSYLTLAPDHRHLYAVSETGTFQGRANSGGVSAFEVNASTGALTLLDQQPSLGGSPCYVSLDHTSKNALVTNYVGGSVALLPVQPNGALAPPAATDEHQPPLGPHPNQNHAHAHCIIPDPANRYAFSVDLGTDKVYGYQLEATAGQLRPLPTPAYVARPGAGPRHLIFHPNGRWAYLENELNSTVTALAYDAAQGTFSEIETLSTLPEGFAGQNSGADVHVSPDGRFVYTSNRGDNSLAVFSIAPADGRLALVQHVSTQGKTPRNFTLDPSGRLLLVANQNSDNIFTYRVDKQTGKLAPTGQSVSLPTPMCVAVVPDFTK